MLHHRKSLDVIRCFALSTCFCRRPVSQFRAVTRSLTQFRISSKQLLSRTSLLSETARSSSTMTSKLEDFTFKGVIAAPCTPFTHDGELNLDLYETYADHMVKCGVTGLFANGTMGEGMAMSVEERKKSAEKWMEVAKGRFDTVIIHTGTGNLPGDKELTSHAEQIGADGVAVMSTVFFKPGSTDALVAYLTEVAKVAPNTPFLYYDINVMTNVVFDTATVVQKCLASIPNFQGIKYSCREIGSYEAALPYCAKGKCEIAVGVVDDVWLPWLSVGAKVPIIASFLGRYHGGTSKAFNSGDMEKAREFQRQAQEIGYIRRRTGLSDFAMAKAIVEMMGIPVGPPRLPILPLTQEQSDNLRESLEKTGFFEKAVME